MILVDHIFGLEAGLDPEFLLVLPEVYFLPTFALKVKVEPHRELSS